MKPHKKTRRWTCVPVPTLHGDLRLDQGVVLEEIRSPIGAVLWKMLRDLLLWSAATPGDRGRLFAPDGGRVERVLPELQLIAAVPELKEPFGGYLRVLQRPDSMQPSAVATIASGVRDWADKAAHVGTALAFAQAAAVADPDDADAAWSAGRLARRRADFYRAKGWFSAAIKRGRDTQRWMPYYRGHVGLGYVAINRGNLPRAEHYFLRAHRAALAHGLTDRVPGTLHNLMWVATERAEFTRARRYANAAARAFPRDHPDLALFAGDYAYLLLEEGRFPEALRVTRAVLEDRGLRPHTRLLYLGNLARAAGGTGDLGLFLRARQDAETLMTRPDAAEAVADAALSIARGAAMLADAELATTLATRALEVANARGEGKVSLMAESLLESVRADSFSVATRREVSGPEAVEATEQLLTKLHPVAG